MDANGHYVRVMSVTGACTLGLNLGCSGASGQGGPAGTVSGVPGAPGPAASGLAPSSISDRELMNMLFGSG
jgi:hypothetical protein